jgi:hypothetical protein
VFPDTLYTSNEYVEVVEINISFKIDLQEILEKRSEMMNDYKRFRERASAEWERMKYRRMELRGGRTAGLYLHTPIK